MYYFNDFRAISVCWHVAEFFWPSCVGPIFVGGPVRPNMLNMPKSASVYEHTQPLGPKVGSHLALFCIYQINRFKFSQWLCHDDGTLSLFCHHHHHHHHHHRLHDRLSRVRLCTVVVCVCVSVCVSVSVCNHFLFAKYLQKLRTDVDEIFGGVGVA